MNSNMYLLSKTHFWSKHAHKFLSILSLLLFFNSCSYLGLDKEKKSLDFLVLGLFNGKSQETIVDTVVTGVLKDASGNPLVNALLTLGSVSGSVSKSTLTTSTRTDANGNFSLYLKKGDFSISITKSDGTNLGSFQIKIPNQGSSPTISSMPPTISVESLTSTAIGSSPPTTGGGGIVINPPTENDSFPKSIEIYDTETQVSNGSTYSFGISNLQGTISKEFTIKNNSSSFLYLEDTNPFKIEGSDPSHFLLEYGANKKFNPWESKKIKIHFKALSLGNKFTSFKIKFKDYKKEYIFQLSGTSSSTPISDIYVTNENGWLKTGTTYSFGSSYQNSGGTYNTWKIKNLGNGNLEFLSNATIKIMGKDSSQFEFISYLPSSIYPKSSGDIIVRFNPTSLGTKFAYLLIDSNDPDTPAYSINLTGTGTLVPQPKLVLQLANSNLAQRDSILFGKTLNNQSNMKYVRIKNEGDANLILSGLPSISGDNANQFETNYSSNSNFTIIAPNSFVDFSISFKPSSNGSKFSTWKLTSNDQINPIYILNLSGEGVPAPSPQIAIYENGNLLPSLSSISFGISRISTPKEKTILIKNNGNADLIFNQTPIAIDGSQSSNFKFTSLNLSRLSPSQSINLKISYTPLSEQVHSSNIIISSNDPNIPNFKLILSGEGYPAICSTCTDTTPPEIKGIQFLSNSASPGETVIARVTIIEKQSSLKSVGIGIMCQKRRDTGIEGQFTYAFVENPDFGMGYVDIPIMIKNGFENGKWYIYSLSAQDNSDKLSFFNYNPSISNSNLSEYSQSGNYISSNYIINNYSFTISGSTNVDLSPPILESIQLEKSSQVGSGKLKVFAKASDPSGIYNGIYVGLQGPKNKISGSSVNLYCYTKLNSSSGLYEGEFTIEPYMENGIWKINNLSITDQLFNSNSYFLMEHLSTTYFANTKNTPYEITSIPIPTVSISGLRTDTTIPTLSSIQLINGQSGIGGNIVYRVYVSDTGSGVETQTANATLFSPSRWSSGSGSTIYSYNNVFVPNNGNGYIDFSFPVKDGLESGEWRLGELNIYDNNKNALKLSRKPEYDCNNKYIQEISNTNSLSSINFSASAQITSSPNDSIPPVLTSVQIITGSVTPGGTVTYRVYAEDFGSGLSRAYVSLYSPTYITNGRGGYYFSSSSNSYNSIGKYFEGTIKIENYKENGDYKIMEVQLYDKLGNYATYKYDKTKSTTKFVLNNTITSVSFSNVVTISGMILDSTPPTLTQIVNNTGIQNGSGLANYTVTANDTTSGISYIGGSVVSSGYWTNKSFTTESLTCARSATNFICNVDFNKYDINEQYQIYSIMLFDEASNYITYKFEPTKSTSKFYTTSVSNVSLPTILSVSGLTPDRDPPIIQSITYEDKSINGCGFVRIRAKAIDSLAGFGNYSSIYSTLASHSYFNTGTGNQSKSLTLYYTQESNEFFGSVFFKSTDENSLWKIYNMSIYDSISNSRHYTYKSNISTTNYSTSLDYTKWSVSPLPIGSGVTKY